MKCDSKYTWEWEGGSTLDGQPEEGCLRRRCLGSEEKSEKEHSYVESWEKSTTKARRQN